jgi:hypothetical protein
MDEEIILDRGDNAAMKLSENERALMHEIELEAPRPIHRAPRPTPRASSSPRRGYDDAEEMDAFINPTKQSRPAAPEPTEFDHHDGPEEYYEDDDYSDDDFNGGGGYGAPPMPQEQPSAGYTSIDDEKADLINKLNRLEKKGIAINKKLNVYSQIDDIRAEVKRVTYSIEIDQSIRFSRRMLVACTTGLEFLNKKFNPFELELDGWSESVMENIDDYDGVFEELYVKYRSSMQVAPEVKLIMMLGGSAMMFHLTNSMFKAAIPNMNDVVKQNPELVQNMMAAVQKTASANNNNNNAQATGSSDGGYEMKGPGLDLGALMGNITMPPQTMSTSTGPRPPPEEIADDISDIVEQAVTPGGDDDENDVKEVDVSKTAKKTRGKGKKKAVEINL